MARGRTVVSFPKEVMGVSFTDNITAALKQFETELREHIIRSGAYAGARVLYDGLHQKVPVDKGTLYGSIYHWFDTKRSTEWEKIYMIGPNKVKAQHWYNVEYGHYRYNKSINFRWQRSKSRKHARVSTPGAADRSVHDLPGALPVPIWVPAVPYIRQTYSAYIGAAQTAAVERLKTRLRELGGNVRVKEPA